MDFIEGFPDIKTVHHQSQPNRCFLCFTNQYTRDGSEGTPEIANDEVHQLKVFILEITMLDPYYLDLEADNNRETFCCNNCNSKLQLLKRTYDDVVRLQYKLNCLSTVFAYQILSNSDKDRHKANVKGENTNDDANVIDKTEWDTQFHEWNVNRIENFPPLHPLNSEKLLNDGEQILTYCLINYDTDDDCEIDAGENSDYEVELDDGSFSNAEVRATLVPPELQLDYQDVPFQSIIKSPSPEIMGFVNQEPEKPTGETTEDRNCLSPSRITADSILPFKCLQCSRFFNTEDWLNDHMSSHGKTFPCQKCQKVYSHKKSLRNHERKFHNNSIKSVRPSCPICSKTVSQKNVLLRHLHSHERVLGDGMLEKFPCKFCGKTFRSPILILAHMTVHEGGFHCTVGNCNKSFKLRTQLEAHIGLHSDGSSLFNCDFCVHAFLSQTNFEKHFKSKHRHLYQTKEFQKFQCHSCGKLFGTKELLAGHMKIHEPKTFNCGACDKSYRTQAQLFTHQLIHTNEKPHHCDKCDAKFRLKSRLNIHIKRVHASLPLLKCEYCNTQNIETSFSRRVSYLKHLATKHQSIYIQSDSVVCKICWKKFINKSELDNHKLKHDRHKCKICDKQFQMKAHLKEHILRHGSVKPFKCSHCDKTFLRRKSVIDHMEKYHTNKNNTYPYLAQVFVEEAIPTILQPRTLDMNLI